ncbi:C40 family peptidase [Nocardia tengchongensis]|uniref:C40 family peptidase n=1 Tax=Nocardia tengchongensis TaxID=2055889 RepID=UPI0036CF83EC
MHALFDAPEGIGGTFSAGYTGARTMALAVADSHVGKDAVVDQAVAVSGDATTSGRGRLVNQIADLNTRIRAIASIADTRFSGPALLDTAQAAITQAARQVDADAASARRLAAQIVPPAPPSAVKSPRTNTPLRRSSRTRRRRKKAFSGSSTNGGNAVRAASNWLGTPYVWGGGGAGGPSGGGFDCSGLTQYAVAQASGGQVLLPRTTYEQIYSGVRVPVHDVRPGDLVFPAGSFSDCGPEHVQLAAGNGMVIEAPSAGSRVKWSRMPDNAIVIRVL